MKKPKAPKNLEYWLRIADDKKMTEQFEQRGNTRQKADLKRAKLYLKWLKIQKNEAMKLDRKNIENELKRKKTGE